jgi:DNA-binding NarL/FixJ family response regulator
LIVTTFGRAGYLRRAMEAGALGFVVKDAPAEQLADAVRRVARGERVVDPTLAVATLAGGVSPLTARERDALAAARDGATIADIAKRLFLSEGTVRNYRRLFRRPAHATGWRHCELPTKTVGSSRQFSTLRCGTRSYMPRYLC